MMTVVAAVDSFDCDRWGDYGLYQYQWGRFAFGYRGYYGIERCSFYGYLRFEGCDGRDRGDDPKGIKDKMTVSLDVKMGISTPVFGGLKYMNSSELLEFGEMNYGIGGIPTEFEGDVCRPGNFCTGYAGSATE